MSSELIPVWYQDKVCYFRLLDRQEAAEIVENPYDVDIEDCIDLVVEASAKPEIDRETAKKMDVETLARFSRHILPDPGMNP